MLYASASIVSRMDETGRKCRAESISRPRYANRGTSVTYTGAKLI